MDLLQSVDLVFSIVNKIVRPQFNSGSLIMSSLQKYDLWLGRALVGRIFSHHALMTSHEHLVAYDSFK